MARIKKIPKFARGKQRHQPLHKQIQSDIIKKTPAQIKEEDDFEICDQMDLKTSSKILKLAQEQQKEEKPKEKSKVTFGRVLNESESDSDEEYEGQVLDMESSIAQSMSKYFAEDGSFEPMEMVISQRINALVKQTEKLDFQDPKVQNVYEKVAGYLSRYRSGKMPRAVMMLPTLQHWEELLLITRPDKWSKQSFFEMTKLMISGLNPNSAQRFMNLFLLPKIKEEIAKTKKLNFHLYKSLKKCLYRPSAFFKGLVLPLCETCTLREAAILASVVEKMSIPVLHSAAVLQRLSQMEYSGGVSLFMRILLDKNYALPLTVIDALVDSFLQKQFQSDLPVLWHQCVLVFVQRYKSNLSQQQKSDLLHLVKVQKHKEIAMEVRKELQDLES